MLYLSLSIIFSSLIYALFTLLGKKKSPLLPSLICNYVVAAACAFGYSTLKNEPLIYDWWKVAIFIGALFITIFLVMAKTTQQFGLATASVASKMSMIIPVVFFVSFLNETFTYQKAGGLLVGIASVILITQSKNSGKFDKKKILLPLILFLGSGFIDTLLKLTEHQYFSGNPSSLFIGAVFFMAAVFGFSYWAAFERNKSTFNKNSLVYGSLLGVINFGSIYYLFQSLSISNVPASSIFPINNIGIVGLSALLGYLLFKQKLNLQKLVGIAFAVIAVLLLK